MGVRDEAHLHQAKSAASAAPFELRIRLPQPLVQRLRQAAASKGCSVSAFTKEALEEKLSERVSSAAEPVVSPLAARIRAHLVEMNGATSRMELCRKFRLHVDRLTGLLADIGARYYRAESTTGRRPVFVELVEEAEVLSERDAIKALRAEIYSKAIRPPSKVSR